MTTLPVYDRLEKQCFERGKKGGVDQPVPIITPRFRLPAFQWKDEDDGAASITRIELIDKATTYADNLITTLTNGVAPANYATLTVVGTSITAADLTGNPVHCESDTFAVTEGEIIYLKYTYDWTAQQHPYISIRNAAGTLLSTDVIPSPASDGDKIRVIRILASAPTARLHIRNTLGADFEMNDIRVTRGDITNYFPTIPGTFALADDVYFQYKGDTLNYLLPVGIWYLKITTDNGFVYYSDWFEVECVYENLITAWANRDYETLTTNGTEIQSLINSAGSGIIGSTVFSVIKGESVRLVFNVITNSGTRPNIYLINQEWTLEDSGGVITAGLNDITLTSTWEGNAYIMLYNNATNVDCAISEVLVMREYSDKYLTINFSNTCDLGDILYQDDFEQTLWFESEAMEPDFPIDEKGVENGEGKFIRTFARQVKKYTARTFEMPSFMVDVFNRMKLHDTVELIDLVGDVNELYNLEVEHEWLWEDRYYAKFDLTFDYDEAFVIGGFCNNLAV